MFNEYTTTNNLCTYFNHAWHAFGLAQALKSKNEDFRVFFYQDGVQVANDLQWVPDDQRNLKHEWQKLGFDFLSVSVLPLLEESLMQKMQRHQLNITT
jgi:tRNA 2-thiouridine synthesizing protein D